MPALVTAGELGDIGFVEFTVNLINGVIDALISANAKQIQSFTQLLADSAKTLADYTATYVADHQPVGVPTTIVDGTLLTPDQITQIAALVPKVTVSSVDYQLLDGTGAPDVSTTTGALGALVLKAAATATTPATFAEAAPGVFPALDTALKAALQASAGNEYQILQQMVKMGFSRIILDSGVIETRLTFTASTSNSSVNQSTSSSVQSSSFGISGTASTRGALAKYLALSVSANYSKVSINMANQVHRDVSNSGSAVQIFGRVELHLKSDYMPLSK